METCPLVSAPCPEEAVRALFGASARIESRRPVSGGCINRARRLRLQDGTLLFLKDQAGARATSPPFMFAREAEGLVALGRAAGGPRVPRPLAIGADERQPFLLMEWITPGSAGVGCYEEFGRALAAMHRETAPAFGFEHDNYIGATLQPNGWERDFTTFFGERRLGYQITLAESRGRASRAMVRGVHRIIERLDELLAPVVTRPALLHGDLWSGNHMIDDQGRVAIIDPAVYFGAPEADLAMSEMFGRLPRQFYDAYQEVAPSAPGYEERREIYNLYHALNHLNLFGGGYAGAVTAAVQRYG